MKKYIYIGFLSLVLIFGVSGTKALAMTTCSYSSPTSATCQDDTNRIEMFYYDSGSWGIYIYAEANAPLLINGTTAPMLVDPAYTNNLRIYSVDSSCIAGGHTTNTADPDFCGNLESTLPVSGNVFTDYVAPPVTGIGLFKSGTGAYTATTMIGQTATALQSTMGAEGLGYILALIGGLLFAFGITLWIVAMFKEASEDKKKRKI